MEENVTLVTREQYIELLIDDSFRDAAEIEAGFMNWCERHVPIWRERGYDEMWIRERIETAQVNRRLHRHCKERGFSMLEIRAELRQIYASHPEFYDMAVERERLHPGPLRYRGNTCDLRQRYTLRVLLYETNKLFYEKFCSWSGESTPDTDNVFSEQPDSVRVVRDLSTVEELEMLLAIMQYGLQLLEAPEKLSYDQLRSLMEAYGKQLRATFISRYGYLPEDSRTPYLPVTVDGPQDHDEYYAKEYPSR